MVLEHRKATDHSDEEMPEPVDVGNVYQWQLFGWVKIDGMFIDEDGNTQVRVVDRSDRRLIDDETLFDLIAGGGLELVGKADDMDGEPWTRCRNNS